MRVVGTFHPSSSVSRSLKCTLTPDSGLEFLVVAKTDKLEVFSLQPEGLKRECVSDMWGRIVGLQDVPAKEEGRSNILVMTDHPDPKLVLLSYDVVHGVGSLTPTGHTALADRTARPAEFVTDFRVDPSGEVVAVSCYTGKFKIVALKDAKLDNAFDVSLPELNLLAFTFLHTEQEGRHTLALLHLNHRQQIQLICRDVDLGEFELSPTHSNLLLTATLSDKTFPSLEAPLMLVPIPSYATGGEDVEGDDDAPAHRGGILILGGRKILFYEHSTQEQQDTRKEKQRRLSKRLAGEDTTQAAEAKEKEKQRESRRIKPRATVKWPWAAVTAWTTVDEGSRRVILGDTYGRLAMVAFDDGKMCLNLIPLGETSPPTCLSYLSSQVLYLGSHYGDSQLLRIHPTPIANTTVDTLPIPQGVSSVPPPSLVGSDKGKGKATAGDLESGSAREGRVVNTKGTFLEVLQNYDNIAPITDAALADIDGSGQPQVITCSGGLTCGSLRVIRTEADFQEQARLDGLTSVTDIWPVKIHSAGPIHTHLVVSTLRETHAFGIEGKDALTHLDPSVAGFATNVPTLALGNIPRREVSASGASSYVPSSLIVQITSGGIQLVEYEPALLAFTKVGAGWYPKTLGGEYTEREIVAAAMSPSQFVVGLSEGRGSGGRLALFNLGPKDTPQLLQTRDFPDEICAISCQPYDRSKNYASAIAVSFWGSNKVAVLALDSKPALQAVCDVVLPTLPRAVLLHNFGTGTRPRDSEFHPYLLVGLADGTLVTYALKDGTLQDRKQSSLGNAPASLSVCTVDGRTVVLASGTRSSVLFWDRQRVRPSPVSVKDMIRGVTLNTTAFPSCLAIATSSALLIGNVRGLDKMQIRSTPLGLDAPRKLAYHAGQGVFGVACTRRAPSRIGDYEQPTGCFKLLDAHSFQQLHNFLCDTGEEPSSVLSLPTTGLGSSPALVLGTVYIRPDEREPSQGRILLFSVSQTEGERGSSVRSLHTLASQEVGGCVYALAHLSENYIIAAINSSVVLFNATDNTAGELTPLRLEKVTEWNHSHFVTNLVVDGEHILVGDAISSVSVLKWNDELGRLESVARDYGPLWPTAIEGTGNGIIGANSDCNLFSFSLQRTPHRTHVEKDGVYHLNDVVNKFLRGALSSTDVAEDQAVKPSHVFFTSSGRIGTVVDMADATSLHMTALQRNMAKMLTGPGGDSHTQLRAPAGPRGHTDAESSYGFLDGDFLEQFLAHPHPEQFMEGEIEAERIMLPVGTVKNVLAQMQSLH
ncbi:mono-functional DNA-alkylating methyl methanesulfonate N-term-domain-containing protein [Ganoderma leucocontextum]|nr:mono-functional DNA-alkylating methyl methanesulfonate N-term-domain-containing protein [Ganoderma leucocontextum]